MKKEILEKVIKAIRRRRTGKYYEASVDNVANVMIIMNQTENVGESIEKMLLDLSKEGLTTEQSYDVIAESYCMSGKNDFFNTGFAFNSTK